MVNWRVVFTAKRKGCQELQKRPSDKAEQLLLVLKNKFSTKHRRPFEKLVGDSAAPIRGGINIQHMALLHLLVKRNCDILALPLPTTRLIP